MKRAEKNMKLLLLRRQGFPQSAGKKDILRPENGSKVLQMREFMVISNRFGLSQSSLAKKIYMKHGFQAIFSISLDFIARQTFYQFLVSHILKFYSEYFSNIQILTSCICFEPPKQGHIASLRA